MRLTKRHLDFTQGHIPKADFIRENYELFYGPLFDVSEHLPNTEIEKIELSRGEVIMTYKNGIKLACEKNEFRTTPLETLNFLKFEEEEVSVFSELLRGKKCLYDIGGNIGFYSVHAANLNEDIRVKAFEPIPKVFAALQKNIALNSFGSRIEAYNMGLSDSAGTVSFFLYPFGGVNASMKNVSGNPEAQEIKAKIMKLDDFVAQGNPAPDIIKCDVEGAEKLVILGALQTIRQAKPVIFLELLRKWSAKFNYHPNEVIELLRAEGYGCFTAKSGKLIPFGKMNDETLETNFFFLPEKQ